MQILLFQGHSSAQSQFCSSEWEYNQYSSRKSFSAAQNGFKDCPQFGQLILMVTWTAGQSNSSSFSFGYVCCGINIVRGAKGQILEVQMLGARKNL